MSICAYAIVSQYFRFVHPNPQHFDSLNYRFFSIVEFLQQNKTEQ